MKFQKFDIKSCCGKSSILLKTDTSLSKDMVAKFAEIGLVASPMFLKSGVLYLESDELVLTGSFGSNNLQARCRKENCEQIIKKLEKNIENI